MGGRVAIWLVQPAFAKPNLAKPALAKPEPAKPTASPAKSYRLISLSPAITETLVDLQLESFLVGTVSLPREPLFKNMVVGVPSVGEYQRPNIEAILALKPTHILTFKEGEDNISARFGSLLLAFSVDKISDYPVFVRRLGHLFGRTERANDLAQRYEQVFAHLKAQTQQSKKSFPLAIEIGASSVFAGQNTFLNEALTYCGGQNIFSFSGFQTVASEHLLSKKPQVIVALHGPSAANTPSKWGIPVRAAPSSLYRLTFRFAEGVRNLCQKLGKRSDDPPPYPPVGGGQPFGASKKSGDIVERPGQLQN